MANKRIVVVIGVNITHASWNLRNVIGPGDLYFSFQVVSVSGLLLAKYLSMNAVLLIQ